MNFTDIISISRIAAGVECSSKKRSLEMLSKLICDDADNINQNDVFDSLIARERLGSTALGKGIAIPHGRLKSGSQTLAAFIQLKDGVDFDAPDGIAVDLLCALTVPEECSDEHLQVLAYLSEIFSNENTRNKLRSASDSQEIYDILTAKRENNL